MISISETNFVLLCLVLTGVMCFIAWAGYEMGRQVEMDRSRKMFTGIRYNKEDGPPGSRYYR